MSGIKWMLPIGPQQCAERDQSIACSFQLYSNASTLTETQKLAPNNDITGDAVIKAFIVSNAFALLFSAILLWDRFQWHFLIHNYSDTRLYLRTIHVVQRLLHGLSDHQLVSGLALLVTLNNQACSISAYHYNLACTMLILSAVTHFNSLFSIQDYIHKGRVVAGIRIVAIIVQYVLSAIVLSGRNVKTGFPTKPGSLGIMPAPCFWNTTTSGYWGVRDALDAASLGDKDTTGNATATDTGIETVATSAAFWEYIMLVVFSGFACVFLVAEWIHTSKHGRNIVVKSKLIGTLGLGLSALSIVASIVVVATVYVQYKHLRTGMEIAAWYQLRAAARQSWSYSQSVNIFLVASTSLHGVQAITESLIGHKGRRFIGVVESAYKELHHELNKGIIRYHEETKQ